MLEPTYQADVVVVGAGVAGLAAAHRLTSQGVSTVVLEAAPVPGGRMATEKVDGFRLDRIGRLLPTSGAELRLFPGLDGLALRPFAPGALVHSEGLHHRVSAPFGAGGARGALHAVRALASTPRPVPGARGPVLDAGRPGSTTGRAGTVIERSETVTGRPRAVTGRLSTVAGWYGAAPRTAGRQAAARRGRAG
ncbi:FAD-dependent oxidoreductase, partial [Streptomyces sp. NPDC023723]|uniref:FAD-dependent oxidoreductase n=1 Tax=Streptomyces sp. NPDC023723 TaxID=3154323 RepID=UPI0033C24E33